MMTPKIHSYRGFQFYWFPNDGKEPPHVHVFHGKDRAISSKFWLGREGAKLAHNKAKFSSKELKMITAFLNLNRDYFIARWFDYFQNISD